MNNKGKGKRSAILEAVIILLIGVGLIFLNLYTENLFRKLHQAGQSAVFVMDDTTFENTTSIYLAPSNINQLGLKSVKYKYLS